jgi:HlyD family secretion protein
MTKRKKKSRRWLWIILGLILVAIIVGLILNNREEVIKVTVEESKLATINEIVSGSGKIFPEKEIAISSDVSGEIINLYVSEGDSVKQGQLLAKIDPDTYVSAVERGKASLNNAKAQKSIANAQLAASEAQKQQIGAQLSNAQKINDRNKQLLENGVISQAEYEASLANLEALQANVNAASSNIRSAEESAKAADYTIKSAEASLRELQTSLRRTTISSPVNGVVSLLNVEEGERVVGTIQMAGTEMMRIANLNAMEVQVEISENNILKVQEGDSVDVEVDAYIDRIFKGTVTEIANTASNSAGSQSQAALLSSTQVTNFICKIRIDGESYQDILTPEQKYPFRPGMSATVDIYTNKVEDVLTVPIQAVTAREIEDDEKGELEEIVFVLEADTLRKVVVNTGIQDNQNIYIKAGLEKGETIVTGPYTILSKELKSGQTVEIVDSEEKEK